MADDMTGIWMVLQQCTAVQAEQAAIIEELSDAVADLRARVVQLEARDA